MGSPALAILDEPSPSDAQIFGLFGALGVYAREIVQSGVKVTKGLLSVDYMMSLRVSDLRPRLAHKIYGL